MRSRSCARTASLRARTVSRSSALAGNDVGRLAGQEGTHGDDGHLAGSTSRLTMALQRDHQVRRRQDRVHRLVRHARHGRPGRAP
jgi:hypothetical protein